MDQNVNKKERRYKPLPPKRLFESDEDLGDADFEELAKNRAVRVEKIGTRKSKRISTLELLNSEPQNNGSPAAAINGPVTQSTPQQADKTRNTTLAHRKSVDFKNPANVSNIFQPDASDPQESTLARPKRSKQPLIPKLSSFAANAEIANANAYPRLSGKGKAATVDDSPNASRSSSLQQQPAGFEVPDTCKDSSIIFSGRQASPDTFRLKKMRGMSQPSTADDGMIQDFAELLKGFTPTQKPVLRQSSQSKRVTDMTPDAGKRCAKRVRMSSARNKSASSKRTKKTMPVQESTPQPTASQRSAVRRSQRATP